MDGSYRNDIRGSQSGRVRAVPDVDGVTQQVERHESGPSQSLLSILPPNNSTPTAHPDFSTRRSLKSSPPRHLLPQLPHLHTPTSIYQGSGSYAAEPSQSKADAHLHPAFLHLAPQFPFPRPAAHRSFDSYYILLHLRLLLRTRSAPLHISTSLPPLCLW